MKLATLPRHAVIERDSQRASLLASGELSALESLLDDDLVYVHSTGLVHGKAELIRFFAETLEVLHVQTSINSFTDGGDIAYIGLFQRMRARLRVDATREVSACTYVGEVWRQRSGDWRLLHFQSTLVGDESAPR
ncbi:YybH family protein [Paraburkholderia caffeinilytica]|uniref:DUF4440 domain-containing protein n=1 Tax=Paraburkholderia caffeinilytica TaxID=1761016 RepID=A0ABQ1LTA1_9BURK|nr:nuclear transport factor 2 family protein [Paraburkholderia caffeinilytica]GGC29688.1 hypothetical protein GCM10011400_15350 [Paraburkholderia caffeinilytica]CAB3781520.1 hypothetical protein LMG28690_01226 [Paraburkholderia caffeinilytica]